MASLSLLLLFLLFYIVLTEDATDRLPNVSPTEIATLQDFYNSTGGPYWVWRRVNESGPHWFHSSPINPCNPRAWQGIECSCNVTDCFVERLFLSTYNLTGTIPSLSGLSHLFALDVSVNRIEEFPLVLLSQANLSNLNLGYNGFRGSIPSTIGQMTTLVALRLSGNNLTGTIPESFQAMVSLTDLDLSFNNLSGRFDVLTGVTSLEKLFLSVNQLTGELPSSISQLHRLQSLQLFENNLVGTLIDQLWTMTTLKQLNLAKNDFHGSVPLTIRNLTNLEYIDFSYNNFEGGFPLVLMEMAQTNLLGIAYCGVRIEGNLDDILIHQSTSNLAVLKLTDNQLTGTIPVIKLRNLTFLALDSNLISGTIPESLCHSAGLRLIYLNDNQMNGSIPNCFGNLSLFDMILSDNSFTGTLPPLVKYIGNGRLDLVDDGLLTANVSGGGVYMVDNNLLTGTVPESLCFASVHTLDLANNALHGTLADCLFNTTIMRIVNVSFNAFDGTISPLIGGAKLMTRIVMNHNAFTGTLPDLGNLLALVYLYVQRNQLTGPLPFRASEPDYSLKFHESIAFVDLSENEFTGTLSAQFFQHATSLMSFAAAGNCFSGSIPDQICDSTGLVFLDLDGIATASACRRPIFPGIKWLKSFTLTKEVVGDIPTCLFHMPSLNTLHLSGNGIKGSFPGDLKLSPSLQYLDLSHNKLTGSIPSGIQQRQFIDLDLSYNKLVGVLDEDIANHTYLTLQVNRISGSIPSSLWKTKLINILTGNGFACGTFREGLPINDYAYENFQCGSNSFNQAIVLWLIFCVVAVGLVLIAVYPHPKFENTVVMRLNSFYQLIQKHWHTIMDDRQFASFATFVRSVCRFVVICVVIILVVFLPLNSGISFSARVQTHQYAWVLSACYSSGFAPGLALTCAYIAFICILFSMWCKMNEQRVQYDHEVLNKSYHSTYQTISLSLVVFVNSIIIIAVNSGYVLAVLYQPSYIIEICQVAIAVFKLFWNEQVVRYMIRISRRMYTHKLSPKHPSFLEVRTMQEMPYLTYMALFNCLIAPFLASAVVDPNCFRQVFVAPQSVKSTFPYSDCNVLQVQKDVCNGENSQASASSISVTYDPPFIYSYQCSSSIMTNYASVYVFMYVITIFIRPPMMLLAVQWCKNVARDTYLYFWSDFFLSSILKPPHLGDLLMNRILFHKERFVLRFISSTAVLLTFGVLFPPLAIVVCGAYFTDSLLYTSLIGRFLNNIEDPITRGLYKEMLIIDADNCWGLFLHPMARLVIPFASMFYGLIVLDTYGDTVGTISAVWMPALIVATPVFLYCARKIYLYQTTGSLSDSELKERPLRQSFKFFGRGSERLSSRRVSEMKMSVERESVFELTDVENPLRKSGKDGGQEPQSK